LDILIDLKDRALGCRLALYLESRREDWRCRGVNGRWDLVIADDPSPRAGYPLIAAPKDANDIEKVIAAVEAARHTLPPGFPFERARAEAARLLEEMGLPGHLKGFICLAWLTAAVTANGLLLEGVTRGLYPLGAKALAMSPAGVEKCARRAVEHIWSHGDLGVLEKYFGQSVDPERGKPTNREFLAMAREHILQKMAKEL